MHGSLNLSDMKHVALDSSVQHSSISVTTVKLSSTGSSNRRMSGSSSTSVGSSYTTSRTSSRSSGKVPKVSKEAVTCFPASGVFVQGYCLQKVLAAALLLAPHPNCCCMVLCITCRVPDILQMLHACCLIHCCHVPFCVVPQVALLFLARDSSPLPNEPVWRAFFEAAARLQLQPGAATAAAAAAERGAASSIQDLLGSRTLHPELENHKPWTHPGYKIQHGLTRGAKRLWPRMLPGQLLKNLSGLRSSNSSSSSSSRRPAWLQFSANSLPRERLFLHKEVQRLLQLAPRQAPASIVADHPQQPQQRQKKNDNTSVRDAMSQLSTIEQAAALEEQLEHTASSSQSIDAPTPGLRRGWWQQQQQQQQDLHGSSSSDSRRGPIHPVLAQQQLFSVYVHSPDGMLLPSSSIFSGTELRVRLNTTQGYAQHVLAEAGVLLLRAALQDASNVHFVMVSDTSIPLYPPQVRGCSKHSKGTAGKQHDTADTAGTQHYTACRICGS
jgi:hypothetical protein